MAFSRSEPGILVSGGVHGALLLATLVVFSDSHKFTDAQEAIPVEMISEADLSQIMKGEKTAKEQKPAPPRAEKVAEVVEPTPKPVIQESKVDVPTPPPPLRRLPDPGEDETPPAPLPPQRVAALPPPPAPEPVKPDPPKPTPRPVEPQKVEAKPEPPKPPDAEAIEPPRPPVRPKIEPPKKAEAPAPEPPKRAPTPPTPPKPDVKADAKPDQKLKPDKIASLLNERKREETAKPPSRPKSGDEHAEPQRRLNPGEISRLLTREDPGQRAATGRELNRTASVGAPNANAAKMSPAMWDQFLGFLKDKYDSCWDSKPPNSESLGYRPKITIRFARNGTLEVAPRLINPTNDPAKRSLADSAIRAVNHPDCNPMRIPARFDPFYEQWKEMPLSFDPSD